MLKKGMILSVVAGIALVSWCAFNAANANVCFLPDGDCSTDNTSSLADGDNPWRNGGPDPKPNNDCSGDKNKPTPKECYDCDSCVNDAGQTLYKNCHIKDGYEVVDGQCVKKDTCGPEFNLTEVKDANCWDCTPCTSNGVTKYECKEKTNMGDYTISGGKCVLAQCPDDYPETTDKTDETRTCTKYGNENCWQCQCKDGYESDGPGNCKCPDDYPYTSNPDENQYNCQPHPKAKGCYQCARKVEDECTYEYRYAQADDLQPVNSQGNVTGSPQNVIGQVLYNYNRLYTLHNNGDVYVDGATPIKRIFNRIDINSSSCKRTVDLYGNGTQREVTFYEKVCAGEPEAVCVARGSNYKFVSNNCISAEYDNNIYSDVEANASEWGDCVKECKNGYNTREECETHITNSDNQVCELADGCYSIVNGSPTKATVKYVDNEGAYNDVGGEFCRFGSIYINGSPFGCSYAIYMKIYKDGGSTLVADLSRTEEQIAPGTYTVCAYRDYNPHGWNNNINVCMTGGLNVPKVGVHFDGSTKYHCASDSVDSSCSFKDLTSQSNGVNIGYGCFQQEFVAGKSYVLSMRANVINASYANLQCNEINGGYY